MLQNKHKGLMMKEHYIDTLFYQIELTAKYCKLLGNQVFEKYSTGITLEEYTVLDTILSAHELCQRDLAKLILKDRANTGKLLDGLEKKGLVVRKLSIKNNRPVKIIEITEDGIQKVNDAAEKIRPHYIEVKEKIKNSNIAEVGNMLKDLRKVLNDSLKIEI